MLVSAFIVCHFMIRLQRYLVRQFQVCSVLTWLIPVTFRHLCWLLLCVPVAMAHHAPGGMPNSNRQRAVTEYVHFQWRELNHQFQRCCASSEPFDVNVWVEQNVNWAHHSQSRLNKTDFREAQRVLICRFNARQLGVDVFWERDYCKRYQIVLDTLPIERKSVTETVAAAQEASLVAMEASPWGEPDCAPPVVPIIGADLATSPRQPVVPTGIDGALSFAERATQQILDGLEEQEARFRAWATLMTEVVKVLAGQLIGPFAFDLDLLGSVVAFDFDFVLCLRLESSARYCREDVMMYIMISLGGLRLPA